MIQIGCTGDKIWDYPWLISNLSSNQNKDISLTISPEAVCLRTIGLYDVLDCFKFKSVTIYTHNPLEEHKKYNIIHKPLSIWANRHNDIDFELYHTWNQTKKFMCLYGRPTAGRLGIGSYIAKKYPEQAHLHFSFPITDYEYHYELDKLLSLRHESILDVGKLITHMPVTLGTTKKYTAFNGYDYSDPLTHFYRDILVDLVVESHVSGKTFFPTEKTFRPILLKKPFIMFASKDYLCYLRQMGFKTFYDYWDEDYDGFEGKERFTKILELIDKLSGYNYSELEKIYSSMQDILDYNYNLLKKKQFTTKIVEVL